MYCSKCGKTNSDTAAFCRYCGSEILLPPQRESSDQSRTSEHDNRANPVEPAQPNQEQVKDASNAAAEAAKKRLAESIQENTAAQADSFIYCTKCGKKNSRIAVFCRYCGSEIKLPPQESAAVSGSALIQNNDGRFVTPYPMNRQPPGAVQQAADEPGQKKQRRTGLVVFLTLFSVVVIAGLTWLAIRYFGGWFSGGNDNASILAVEGENREITAAPVVTKTPSVQRITPVPNRKNTPTPTPTPTSIPKQQPVLKTTPTPTPIVSKNIADLCPVYSPSEPIYNETTELYVGDTIFFDTGVSWIAGYDIKSGDFNIKWFVNGVEMGYGLHSSIWGGVTEYADNSQFYWTPTTLGKYEIVFLVDCDNTVDETDENNNTLKYHVTILEHWGEKPVQLGTCAEDKFDIYKYKAEVDLNGDGILDKIEYHAGQTITINGLQFQSTHVNFAQCFAIIDLYPNDGHLEVLLTSAYRDLPDDWWTDPYFDVPGSYVCWWDGSNMIYGSPMPGVMFDKDWVNTFDPYFHFGQGSIIKLYMLTNGSNYSWHNCYYDTETHRIMEFSGIRVD